MYFMKVCILGLIILYLNVASGNLYEKIVLKLSNIACILLEQTHAVYSIYTSRRQANPQLQPWHCVHLWLICCFTVSYD